MTDRPTFRTAAAVWRERRCQHTASTRNFFIPVCEYQRHCAPTLGPEHYVRDQIQSLVKDGNYEDALRLARSTADEELLRQTAVNVHRVRIRRWKSRVAEEEDHILPSRESILGAAHECRDQLCARLVEMFYRRSSSENPLADADLVQLVRLASRGVLLQTAYKMREFGLFRVVDVELFEELLESGFLPLVRHLAGRQSTIDEINELPVARVRRIQGKYAHCALRFFVHQSRDIDRVREFMHHDHIDLLPDADFVGVCREQGVLCHLLDAEVIALRTKIRGTGVADRFGSARLFEDAVSVPWAPEFLGWLDGVFDQRVGASMDRVYLRRAITLPTLLSPRAPIEASRAA